MVVGMGVAQNSEADGSPGLVHHGIVDGLYRGRYVPGQRLVEADLTRDFNVGRGSVREALNRLAAEGIVSMSLHRSAVIRSLSRAEARDIAKLLEVLNGLAARLAAERIGVGDNRKILDEAFAQIASSAVRRDFLRFARARNRFYGAIVEIGGNQELARLMPRTNVDLLRVQFRAFWPAHDDARVDFYRAIYEAICDGSARKAKAAAKAHLRQIGETIEALPDAAFAGDGR